MVLCTSDNLIGLAKGSVAPRFVLWVAKADKKAGDWVASRMTSAADLICTVPDSTTVEKRAPNGVEEPGIESAWSAENLRRVFSAKHGTSDRWGWSPNLQRAFGYFNPDDHYEALVDRMIQPETKWLDVGCGRSPFPNNSKLAKELSERCTLLVGVDPSGLADSNPYVHRVVRAPIEGFKSAERFDLVTLRMVAEHLENPVCVLRNLSQLMTGDGKVVVYTVSQWSPGTLMSRMLPFRWHHCVKKLAWDVQEEDTFPAFYRLNTRGDLRSAFYKVGLHELLFGRLDDCSISGGFRALRYAELSLRGAMKRLSLPYPESCLIGVYGPKRF